MGPGKRSAAFRKRAYREMVQELDKGVGEIVAALKRLGLEKNTLVFFVSDNGAASFGNNGSLRGNKGQLWEGGHRVPAIASWPGRIEAGSSCDDLSVGMEVELVLGTLYEDDENQYLTWQWRPVDVGD